MWLLDVQTLKLHEFIGDKTPPYTILSHTWGLTEDEVSFSDMRGAPETARAKSGFDKIQKVCEAALKARHSYVWVDSCCIDKSSSAELSEAINSMFKWYQSSMICFVYLSDV